MDFRLCIRCFKRNRGDYNIMQNSSNAKLSPSQNSFDVSVISDHRKLHQPCIEEENNNDLPPDKPVQSPKVSVDENDTVAYAVVDKTRKAKNEIRIKPDIYPAYRSRRRLIESSYRASSRPVSLSSSYPTTHNFLSQTSSLPSSGYATIKTTDNNHEDATIYHSIHYQNQKSNIPKQQQQTRTTPYFYVNMKQDQTNVNFRPLCIKETDDESSECYATIGDVDKIDIQTTRH